MGVHAHELFYPHRSSYRRSFSATDLHRRRCPPHPHSQTARRSQNQRPHNLWRAPRPSVSLPHSLHRRAAHSFRRTRVCRLRSASIPPPASSPERLRTKPGIYPVTLLASNASGKSSRLFRIVVGDTLALTPPMGWNTWYSDYGNPTAAKVRQAADAMISSGMADFGYQYVNVDDGWPMKPGSTEPRLERSPARPAGSHSPQRPLQRYGCTGRLYPRERSQGRPLLLPRPAQLRGLYGLLSARSARRRNLCRVEVRLPQIRLVLLWSDRAEKSHHCRLPQTLRPDGRPAQNNRTAISSSTSASTAWATSGLGRADSGGNSWRTTGDLGEKSSIRGCPASTTSRWPTPPMPATPAPAIGTIPTTF